MKKLIFLILFLFSTSALAGTYYIDPINGSDANDGLTKATAWRRAPGMSDYTGSYFPQPGDRFIFKGGETCAIDWETQYYEDIDNGNQYSGTCWRIEGSGVEGSPIVYTVDKSWYEGTEWTKPIIIPIHNPFLAMTAPLPLKVPTNITKGNPAVVTLPGHGYLTGHRVGFHRVAGMVEMEGRVSYITVIDADTFSLDRIDSTNFSDFVYSDQTFVGDPTIGRLVYLTGNNYLTFEGLHFGPTNIPNNTFGNRMLELGGNKGITFRNCDFVPYDSFALVHGAGTEDELIDGCYFKEAIGFSEYTYMAPGIKNLEIKNCHFDGFYEMNVNSPHADGVQFHDKNDDGDVINFQFHNNYMTGDWGTADPETSGFNSWVYLNNRYQTVTGPLLVYNNIADFTMSSPGEYIGNAVFVFDNSDWGATADLQMFNNTFYIHAASTDIKMKCIFRMRLDPESNYKLYNNLVDSNIMDYIYWFQDVTRDNPDDKNAMNTYIDHNTYNINADSYIAILTGADPCGQNKTWDCWRDAVVRLTGEPYNFDIHTSYLEDTNLDSSYTPQEPSSAINTGQDPFVNLTYDYYMNPRPVGGAFDMGAVENQGGTPPPVGSTQLYTYDGNLIRYNELLVGE